MNTLATFVFGFFKPFMSSHPNTGSASLFLDSMPMYSRMYINGTDLKKEIKRTPRGYLIRDITSQDSILYSKNKEGLRRTSIVSETRWSPVPNQEALELWFATLDVISGDRSRCQFKGSAYVLSIDTHFVVVADDTCEWSGATVFTDVYTPSMYGGEAETFLVDKGED